MLPGPNTKMLYPGHPSYAGFARIFQTPVCSSVTFTDPGPLRTDVGSSDYIFHVDLTGSEALKLRRAVWMRKAFNFSMEINVETDVTILGSTKEYDAELVASGQFWDANYIDDGYQDEYYKNVSGNKMQPQEWVCPHVWNNVDLTSGFPGDTGTNYVLGRAQLLPQVFLGIAYWEDDMGLPSIDETLTVSDSDSVEQGSCRMQLSMSKPVSGSFNYVGERGLSMNFQAVHFWVKPDGDLRVYFKAGFVFETSDYGYFLELSKVPHSNLAAYEKNYPVTLNVFGQEVDGSIFSSSVPDQDPNQDEGVELNYFYCSVALDVTEYW